MMLRRPNIEHVIPTKRGRDDGLGDLVFACYDCDQRKGSRTGEVFRRMPDDPVIRLNTLSSNMRFQTIADAITYTTLHPTIFVPLCEDLLALQAARPQVPYPPPL